jgi:uncharacterized OB-fold protein
VTADQTQVQVPLPRPSPISKPYWEAARRHELLLQRCAACKQYVFYPRLNCTNCGSRQLDWVTASGHGTVYTYTVARRPTHPSFAARTPYVIAIVELEEGPRMTTNIVDCDPDSVKIGMPVEATFEDVSPDVTLVVFRPASS